MSNFSQIAETITNAVISNLDNGRIPWVKPWKGGVSEASSHTTGKGYSLLNQLFLYAQGAQGPAEYITYVAAKKEGGNVKKGAKGKKILFSRYYQRESEKKELLADGKDPSKATWYTVFRMSTVFDVNDCENIKPRFTVDLKENVKPSEQAEKVIDDYAKREGMEIKRDETNNRAYYSLTGDYIRLPHIGQFDSEDSFYSTAFHEMIHSTGNKKRLDRFEENESENSSSFKAYSFEELVAELGSCFLCALVGVEPQIKNASAYIQGWRNAIAKDNSLVLTASIKAQKAVNYILNGKQESDEDEDEAEA